MRRDDENGGPHPASQKWRKKQQRNYGATSTGGLLDAVTNQRCKKCNGKIAFFFELVHRPPIEFRRCMYEYLSGSVWCLVVMDRFLYFGWPAENPPVTTAVRITAHAALLTKDIMSQVSRSITDDVQEAFSRSPAVKDVTGRQQKVLIIDRRVGASSVFIQQGTTCIRSTCSQS